MKPVYRLLCSLMLVLALMGCIPGRDGVLIQHSTIDALLTGVYDGPVTLAELKTQGDFGIGTFNNLDGEMAMLDGIIYRIGSDGSVSPMPGTTRTPFASVTYFHPDQVYPFDAQVNYEAFQQATNLLLPSRNQFYAIRVDGVFSRMKTRSVPRQEPPYRPLAEVVAEQSVFEFENVQGTLLGFWTPDFGARVNVPGYHLHFLSDDRTQGGHVLDFTMDEGVLLVDVLRTFVMVLPDDEAFLSTDLTPDRSDELETVEQDR